MPVVSLDSNVIDLVTDAFATRAHANAAEAGAPPPRFRPMIAGLLREVWACYWLVTLAPYWRSTIYTFSEALYAEIERAPDSAGLLRVAVDVLVRDSQPAEYRVPDPTRRPPAAEVQRAGLSLMDAEHVADAVGVGSSYFLTNDRRLRRRSPTTEARWDLRLRQPSEFLEEAVRAGAPWPTHSAWPWEVGAHRA